ncbi:MAG TPA: SMP-30/gluconolactonase/LRE family protein [Candidatus Dormibacteraeota bacterium]|nr:SMP-30/gluconolactonase/LRE family protein [Candidatus Dormibacteraeota bacterium]
MVASNRLGTVSDVRCEIGENPLWHRAEQCLYWIDIPAGRIYRYSPRSGTCERIYEGKVVGGFTIQADYSLLLFMAEGAIAQLKDGKLNIIIDGIPDERNTRFNDVIADPRGRVFCGTMPSKECPGRLYRLDLDGTLTKLLDGIQCSNGLAFSVDLQHLYYTDSYAHVIYRFDYAEQTGDITNQEVAIRGVEADGYPDGLVRDAEGYLWSARWGGGCIIRYSPEGVEERRIKLPVKRVTSVAFGGPRLADMYVTTARDAENADAQPDSGAVFRVQTGIRGVPEFHSRIRLTG